MAKKNRRSKSTVVEVVMDSVRAYKNNNGLVVVEGTVGSHTIHRAGGNERAALNKVQRAFNRG